MRVQVPQLREPAAPGVVNLDGPADLQAVLPLQDRVCGRPVVTDLMGGSPDERPERYREASPGESLPLGVRQEVFAGRIFGEQAELYAALARQVGDRIELTVDEDANHFVFIDPASDIWPHVLETIRRLLLKPD